MKKLIVVVLACFAAAGSAHAQQLKLSISTGGTGGVWYPMGGAMANVLSKSMPNTSATAEVTGGSVDNVRLLATGKTDIGFSMVDTAWEGMNGLGKFKDKVPMRTLAVVHPLVMHVVTAEGRGIAKMSELKGKRVSTGSPGSATEVMAFRVIEAAGLNRDKDLRRERLGVAESVNALKDKKIDAFFWVGGLPTAAVTDLAATPGLTIKLVDHADAVPAMNKKYGNLYVQDVIPKSTYAGMEKDNRNATVWNILVADAKMSDQTAYDIVKTIFEKKPELVAVHKEANNFDLKYQTDSATPTPWHPGAKKYFAERGVKLK